MGRSTLPSRTPSRPPSRPPRTLPSPLSSPQTLPAVAPPVPCLCSSYTPSTTPVQRPDRRLREDSEVRWHPGPVQRLHHLCSWYLHLPWHVLRPLRHPEASAARQGRWSLPLLLPGMGCHRHCWTHVLPH